MLAVLAIKTANYRALTMLSTDTIVLSVACQFLDETNEIRHVDVSLGQANIGERGCSNGV